MWSTRHDEAEKENQYAQVEVCKKEKREKEKWVAGLKVNLYRKNVDFSCKKTLWKVWNLIRSDFRSKLEFVVKVAKWLIERLKSKAFELFCEKLFFFLRKTVWVFFLQWKILFPRRFSSFVEFLKRRKCWEIFQGFWSLWKHTQIVKKYVIVFFFRR